MKFAASTRIFVVASIAIATMSVANARSPMNRYRGNMGRSSAPTRQVYSPPTIQPSAIQQFGTQPSVTTTTINDAERMTKLYGPSILDRDLK
ncbi:hypothetical protein [Rubripirellula tenax]|uniref:hypothetical protein n=1 Tax=Rubripirellula tenax TaxID=2528015 RepID=UPI0011B7DEA0|nr:hypothetical protein [Rubripirellula tenax]